MHATGLGQSILAGLRPRGVYAMRHSASTRIKHAPRAPLTATCCQRFSKICYANCILTLQPTRPIVDRLLAPPPILTLPTALLYILNCQLAMSHGICNKTRLNIARSNPYSLHTPSTLHGLALNAHKIGLTSILIYVPPGHCVLPERE